MQVRLPGSGHVGSTRRGRLPIAVDGLTNSQIWPVVAVDLTISNHGIQSSGFLRMSFADVVVEDILETGVTVRLECCVDSVANSRIRTVLMQVKQRLKNPRFSCSGSNPGS